MMSPPTCVSGNRALTASRTCSAICSRGQYASIIIDVLMQAVTQLLFAALGLVTLVALGEDMPVAGIAATGLALAALERNRRTEAGLRTTESQVYRRKRFSPARNEPGRSFRAWER
jgi:hypothetical protein